MGRSHSTQDRRRRQLAISAASSLLVFAAITALASYRIVEQTSDGAALAAAPGTQSITVKPSNGPAADAFSATYHVDLCGAFARFFWGPSSTLVVQVAYDGSCNAAATITPPPSENAPGTYVVVGRDCTSTRIVVCDSATDAIGRYTIDPVPTPTPSPTPKPTPVSYAATIMLQPQHGQGSDTFQAIYQLGPICPGTARFDFDGIPVAASRFDANCTAIATIISGAGAGTGTHVVSAIACVG